MNTEAEIFAKVGSLTTQLAKPDRHKALLEEASRVAACITGFAESHLRKDNSLIAAVIGGSMELCVEECLAKRSEGSKVINYTISGGIIYNARKVAVDSSPFAARVFLEHASAIIDAIEFIYEATHSLELERRSFRLQPQKT